MSALASAVGAGQAADQKGRLHQRLEEASQIGFSEAEATRFFGRPDAALMEGLNILLRPPVEVRAEFTERHGAAARNGVTIRRAGALDTRALADLLNAIIAEGGTTAMVSPVSPRSCKAGWPRPTARGIWRKMGAVR